VAHAYTPGLRITDKTLVRKERRLPLKGEVLTAPGNRVQADTVVARTDLPGGIQTVNIAGILGIPPEDVRRYMVKQEGDGVEEGEVIARSRGFFGLFTAIAKSPVTGHIESVSDVTGQVIIREPSSPVEVDAYVDGEVVEVFENEGCVVQTVGTFIQGIFGIGGESRGELIKVADTPADILTGDEIDGSCRGKVLISGALVTREALDKAAKEGVSGIIVGGIDDRDLMDFLGYEIGVAITGSEEKGITLIITEGFGRMKMTSRTFELLVERVGKRASINGTTQIRAGVIRPEVIIPLDTGPLSDETKKESPGLEIGSPVRIIREPYFGALGKVLTLPSELQEIETEARVRVLEVQLEDGRRVVLPRANVEMIEEGRSVIR